MNELEITVTRSESRDSVVVRPAGSINSTTVAQLDATINDLVNQRSTMIVLDLSGTNFISSSGVGLLVGTVDFLRKKNGDLVLMNLPKLVNDIFDVLNIKQHFRIIKDLTELKAGART
jgi:anti-anti-sigma factor